MAKEQDVSDFLVLMWITTTFLSLWSVEVSEGGYDGRKIACAFWACVFYEQRLLNSEKRNLNLPLYSSIVWGMDYEHWAVNLDVPFYFLSRPCFEFSSSVIYPFLWSQNFQTNIANIFFQYCKYSCWNTSFTSRSQLYFSREIALDSIFWLKIEEQKDFSCPNYCFLF